MGGITRYLLTLAKGLRRLGHEVHLASGGGDMIPQFEALGAKHLLLSIRTKSELDPKIYLALRPLAKYIEKENIEIVHAQTRITQVMGSLLHKFKRVPYVSTCHGYFKPRLSRRWWPCWGECIAISPAVAEHLHKDFHLPKEKIHLVTHGIDLEDFSPISLEEKVRLRKQYMLKDEPVIGMIARLSPIKGQDILIRAMPQILEQVPNAKLLLFGEGKTRNELIALVQQLNLRKRIEFYPIIDQTAQSLSVMNVVVVPSRQEGLGLSVMEAQACAVAVVASRVGGIPSLIEDGKTGVLVEAENVAMLADRVVTLLKDDARRNSMGLSAREYALKHYSSQRMVDRTLEVYRNAINR